MDDNTLDSVFSKISADYFSKLLNWSIKKTVSREEAEDLTQDIMLKIFTVLKDKLKSDVEIQNMDGYIWKIAQNTYFVFRRKKIFSDSCAPLDDVLLNDITDHTSQKSEEGRKRALVMKMRHCISKLDFLQQEIIIMYYYENLSMKEIASLLKISVSKVNWHLVDTRKRIKKEVMQMDNHDVVYRPRSLNVLLIGFTSLESDVEKINESISKQNICLACLEEAQSTNDLVEKLGIPKRYVEQDIEWLVSKGFITQSHKRYLTAFPICTLDSKRKIYQAIWEKKSSFSEKLVQKLISREKQIKDIGFIGSDKPINKLLWVLIYNFFVKILDSFDYINSFNNLTQISDGKNYFAHGKEISQRLNLISEECGEKYQEISTWNNAGVNTSYNEKMTIYFHKIYTSTLHEINKIILAKWEFMIEVFAKLFKEVPPPPLKSGMNRAYDELSSTEKNLLDEMTSWGWLSKKGDGHLLPNFCVFTSSQKEALDNIFDEIYTEMKDELLKVYSSIDTLCKAIYHKRFSQYFPHLLNSVLITFLDMTIGFAFYDGWMYQPKDANECALLTFKIDLKT